MATGFTRIPYTTVLPEQILAHFNISIDDNNKCVCPFHADTFASMQVNKEFVYCYGCQWTGDVWNLSGELLKMHGESADNIGLFLRSTNFPSPSGRVYRTSKYMGGVSLNLIDYWHNSLLCRPELLTILQKERMLTLDTIKHFKLGYRPDKDAWVIPFLYDKEAEIVQFRSRKSDEPGVKYWGLEGHQRGTIMNRDTLDTPQDYVVLLMGAYDPTLAWQDGLPALGMNGSMPFTKKDKERVKNMFSKQTIKFIVPDNNPEEHKAAKKLAEWIDGEVRYFPDHLPHNTDYIDYRQSGKTAEDFKREVLGILPYEDITDTSLFDNLCSLYDVGDPYKFAEVYLEFLAKGKSYADAAIALANGHVKEANSRRKLYGVKSKEDFIEAMQYRFVHKGSW